MFHQMDRNHKQEPEAENSSGEEQKTLHDYPAKILSSSEKAPPILAESLIGHLPENSTPSEPTASGSCDVHQGTSQKIREITHESKKGGKIIIETEGDSVISQTVDRSGNVTITVKTKVSERNREKVFIAGLETGKVVDETYTSTKQDALRVAEEARSAAEEAGRQARTAIHSAMTSAFAAGLGVVRIAQKAKQKAMDQMRQEIDIAHKDIRNISEAQYPPPATSDENVNKICPICRSSQPLMWLPCAHSMCRNCYNNLLTSGRKACPACNTPFLLS